MIKFEYQTRTIQAGGSDARPMEQDLNEMGSQGWELCGWVYDWRFSEGPGHDARLALFKRSTEGKSAEDAK